MNTIVIEAALALFWLAYLGLHLWLLRAAPPEDETMPIEIKEQASCTMPLAK